MSISGNWIIEIRHMGNNIVTMSAVAGIWQEAMSISAALR
jgi:hypothetical protein